MAVKQGYFARIVWTDSSEVSYAVNAFNWSLTYEAGEGETTAFPTGIPAVPHPKDFLPLSTEWSGSMQLRLDAEASIPDFEDVLTLVKLYINAHDAVPIVEFGYGGNAFCKAQNPSADVNGVPEATVNFRGSGALTIGDISGLV